MVLDIDRDGYIAIRGFKLWHSQGLVSTMVLDLFAPGKDINSDGAIDNDRYVKVLLGNSSEPSFDAKWMYAAWLLADKNDDAHVTRTEMGLLQQHGSLHDSASTIFEADRNNDGRLDRSEFYEGLELLAAKEPRDLNSVLEEIRSTEWLEPKKKWCCIHEDVCQYPTPVVDAYDCEQALGNVSSWPEVKRAWCCSRHGLGCPKQEVAKYDCQRGWVDGAPLWGDEQRYWCCFHTGLGCVSTSKPYDCAAGLENWKAGWSEQKKHWCCENEGTACRVQFDCAAGLANWEHGWTQDKKQWCCRAGHATCIKESHGYDCDADFSRWQAVWPEDKRTWCCHNTDRGCFKVESFTERYDCYNDVPSWDTHRRKWCCEHHRDTCDVGLPAQ